MLTALVLSLFLFAAFTTTLAQVPSNTAPKLPRSTDRIEKMEVKAASREAKILNNLENKEQKIASRAAMFEQKIATFRNKQKATIAQRINLTLATINQNRTQAMTNRLSLMSEILAKLESRVNIASSNGADVSKATEAISAAKTAIQVAEAALAAQSQKDYTIVVSTEAGIGQDAKSSRNSLLTDLKTTQSLITAARQAVANAISVSVSTLKGNSGGQ